MKQNNIIIGLIAIIAVLGFTVVVDQLTAFAVERTLRQVDTALTTLEKDFTGNLTRITSLEDSKRDFNPVINQNDVTVIVPANSGNNSDTGTFIVLACGETTSTTEIPIGFSFEMASPRDAEFIHFKQLALGMDSPDFNELVVEMTNTSTPPRDISVELFLNCAVIDVIQ